MAWALGRPLIVQLEQDGADEPSDCVLQGVTKRELWRGLTRDRAALGITAVLRQAATCRMMHVPVHPFVHRVLTVTAR